jgi:hypothetical protein
VLYVVVERVEEYSVPDYQRGNLAGIVNDGSHVRSTCWSNWMLATQMSWIW